MTYLVWDSPQPGLGQMAELRLGSPPPQEETTRARHLGCLKEGPGLRLARHVPQGQYPSRTRESKGSFDLSSKDAQKQAERYHESNQQNCSVRAASVSDPSFPGPRQ